MKTKLQFIFLFLTITSLSWAQGGKTVTGTVTDDTGGPLPGVSVLVQGTTTGTQTDFDGNYTLDVATGDILEFSYLGFQTQEITVADQTEINVNMVTASNDLDEVVVVGYGNQKRSDITGAVVSVKADEITKQPALTALQSVQGKVAGVNIIASDSPGATPSVLVRGLGTAQGGRNPFYVVDGQPVQDIRSISPNDIESIDFLKGASYANIYGIRAANGVILITTKKGKIGKPRFNFESYYGVRNVLNKVKMANASQYIQYFNEENAIKPDPADRDFLFANQRYDTDWYDELLQLGTITNNSFSVSGAGETVNYFFSYNYYDEEGILNNNKYSRGSIRSNNTFKLFDNRFRIIPNVNITYTKEQPKPFSAFTDAYRQSPLVPVFFDNGRYGGGDFNRDTGIAGFEAEPGQRIGNLVTGANPVASVDFEDTKINTLTLQGQLALELDVTDKLQATARYGATRFFSTNENYTPIRQIWLNADPTRTVETFEAGRVPNEEGIVSTEFANNSYRINKTDFYRWNVEGFLTYTDTFGDNNLSVTAGLSRENFGGRQRLEGQAYDVYQERRLRSLDLNTSSLFDKTVTNSRDQSTNLQSYFARFEYDFDKRYFIRGVIRRDGTSDFVTGENFFDEFPAASIGWTVTNEKFMEDNELFSNLKLFSGWGQLGNANVPINIQQVNTNAGSENVNYVFGPNQNLIFGAALGSPVDRLQWEVTEEFEAGFDYGLFNNKLNGTFTYYNRKNTNAIINVQNTLNSSSPGNFLAQAAEVSNTGFEGLINWQDAPSQDFNYSVNLNFSTNKNEVQNVRAGFDRALGGNLPLGERTKQLLEGESLYSFWLYETDGVWQTQEEIDNNPSLGNALVGRLRYKDLNGDGSIDDRDKRHFGNYIPTFNYGIRLGLNYKNIDFSVDGFGVGGNKVFNGLLFNRLGGENVTEETFNKRWTASNPSNSNPAAYKDREPSNYYLEDGDYFRINNITLGYSFKEMSIINSARLYVTVQNAFMFTKYSGFTPEINSDGDPTGTTGIELAAYPTTRTFIIGANFQL